MEKFFKPTWGKFIVTVIGLYPVNLYIRFLAFERYVPALCHYPPGQIGCPLFDPLLCYQCDFSPTIILYFLVNFLTLLLSYLLSCTIVFFAHRLKKQEKNRTR